MTLKADEDPSISAIFAEFQLSLVTHMRQTIYHAVLLSTSVAVLVCIAVGSWQAHQIREDVLRITRERPADITAATNARKPSPQ